MNININKEVIMSDDKKEASAGATENLKEALVLRPEWEIKPKRKERHQVFSVSFNETTKHLELSVNGEEYKTVIAKDNLSNQIRYHEVLSNVVNKFELWGLRDKN